MFEVLFGRLVKETPTEYLDELCFSVKLAQNHYENEKLDEIIDSDLRAQMNTNSLAAFSNIAYQCLKKRKEERPKMSQVVEQLQKALDYHQGTSGFLYDVYVSFRARDCECQIVNDMCAALEQEGISTNKDDETQPRKESMLLKTIARSRLFVIIFTKKFVVNPWYSDEVAKIIECMRKKGQFVLPVFYNVSYYDVRTEKGYFGK
nr:Toll/interleukin-1 receptor (TIR) domain-containing protein [Tanacetum cinerariifolium]